MIDDWVLLGCGYIATRLARELLAAGHAVRICTLNPDKHAELGALGATLVKLDASKMRVFGPALYRARQPVVLYGIPPVKNMPAGEPMRRATEAALGVGAQRFIYLSSTAIFGQTTDGEVVDENTSLALMDPDAGALVADEGALEGSRLGGLQTVVLRLTAVYGPGRGVRERLRKGNYKLLDEGAHVYSRVHVDDVVGIIRAAADRAPPGAVYCVSDDRPTTQREYTEWLVRRLQVAAPPSVPSLAPGRPRRAIRNRHVANARVKEQLGYQFRYPSYVEGEEAIEREQAAQPAAAPPPAATPTAPAEPAPTPPPPAPAPPPPAVARHAVPAPPRFAVETIDLPPGAGATLPPSPDAFLYVLSGSPSLNGRPLAPHHLSAVSDGNLQNLSTDTARVLHVRLA